MLKVEPVGFVRFTFSSKSRNTCCCVCFVVVVVVFYLTLILNLKSTTQAYFFPFLLLFCNLVTILFNGYEKYQAIIFQFGDYCSLFIEKNSPLWTQQISSLNDCEARTLQPSILGGKLTLWLLIRCFIFLTCEKTSFANPIGRFF